MALVQSTLSLVFTLWSSEQCPEHRMSMEGKRPHLLSGAKLSSSEDMEADITDVVQSTIL